MIDLMMNKPEQTIPIQPTDAASSIPVQTPWSVDVGACAAHEVVSDHDLALAVSGEAMMSQKRTHRQTCRGSPRGLKSRQSERSGLYQATVRREDGRDRPESVSAPDYCAVDGVRVGQACPGRYVNTGLCRAAAPYLSFQPVSRRTLAS